MPRKLRKRVKTTDRACGECLACDKAPECGWKQGLLGLLQRPDEWGMRLEGRKLPGALVNKVLVKGRDVFVFKEVIQDVRFAHSVRSVLSATALHMPIVVTDTTGTVVSVMGPAEEADEVMQLLGVTRYSVDGDVVEVEMEAQPTNPL